MALEKTQQVFFARQGVEHTATDAEVIVRPFNVVKVTSTTDDGDFNDSVRAGDADSFWDEYFLIGVVGANKGVSRQITTFTSAGGNFVTATDFSSLVSVGDIFAILKKASPNVGSLSFTPNIASIIRDVIGGTLDNPPPISILQGSSVSFAAHVMGVAAAPAAGTLWPAPPMADLFRSAMGQMLKGTTQVTTGAGSVTQLDIAAAQHEDFNFGQCVLVRNAATGNFTDEARWVVGKTDGASDNLHIKPNLTNAPSIGEEIFGGTTFGLVESGHPAVTVEIYQPDTATDGQVIIIRNALANFSLAADTSTLLTSTFTLEGGELSVTALGSTHFSRTISASEVDEEPSFGPVRVLDGQLGFRTAPAASAAGVSYSTTLRDATQVALDTANVLASKVSLGSSSGVVSTSITGRAPVLTVAGYFEGAFTDFADLTNAVVKDVQLQLGPAKQDGSDNDLRSVFVLRSPYALINASPQGVTDGLINITLTMGAAKDASEGFEDPDLGDVTHNTPLITDAIRMAIF